MAFSEYSTTPRLNTSIGNDIYIGPNMARDDVREALQTLAADGKRLQADVALAVFGTNLRYFPNTTAGLAATESGEFFAVANGDGTVSVYLNDNGVASLQAEIGADVGFVGTLSEAKGKNNGRGSAALIFTSDRGPYIRSSDPPSDAEADYDFGFTDEGDTHWVKPATRIYDASEFGIQSCTTFNEDGTQMVGAVDQAPRLQALIDRIRDNGGGLLRLNNLTGALPLGSSILVHYGVSIDGLSNSYITEAGDYVDGLRIMPMADGAFYDRTGVLRTVADDDTCEQGVLFWCNVDPAAPNTWVVPYSGMGSGTYENMAIDGGETGGICAFYAAGSHVFRHHRTFAVNRFYDKPYVYADAVTIQHIVGQMRPNNTDYFISVRGLGDELLIDQISADYTGPQTGMANAVLVENCYGGKVTRVVNGVTLYQGGSGIIHEVPHNEGGQIIVDGSDVTILGGCVYHGAGGVTPIIIRNTDVASKNGYTVNIDYVTFVHPISAVADITGWSATPLLDVDIQTAYFVTVNIGKGCRRKATTTAEPGNSKMGAIMVGNSDWSGVYPEWKAHAVMLCREGATIISNRLMVNGSTPARLANFSGIFELNYTPLYGNATYQGPTGNNRYRVRLIADYDRKLGREPSSGEEVVIAATNGSTTHPGFQIDVFTGGSDMGVLFEVLRDTGNDGNWDKIAYVPAFSISWLWDNGNAIASYPWEAYGPSASAPTLNNPGFAGRARYTDGLIEILDSVAVATPTVGTWQAGDRIWFPFQAPDSYGEKSSHTICRAGGTPGTWDWQRASSNTPATTYIEAFQNYTIPSLAAGASTTQNVTLTGAFIGDVVVGSFTSPRNGVDLSVEVTATDTVTFTLKNNTGSTIGASAAGQLRARKLS